MGFLVKEAKIFYGITAVILLLLLILTTTACGTKSDPDWVVVLSTPAPSTPLPPVETAVIIPPTETSLPTPPVKTNIEQVLFAPGSTTTRLGHQLQASESFTHTFYGLIGQKLFAQIVANHDDMIFTILDKNKQELETTKGSNPLSITLLTDGDCFIVASAPTENGHQYGYSLELSLTNDNATGLGGKPTMQPIATSPPVIPPTFTPMPIAETAVQPSEEILFEPNETMITKGGQLEGNTGKEYVLQATAGQTLTIYANASQPGIKVSVTGKDGTTFDDFRNGETFSNKLPATQDYFIHVMPQATSTSQDFSLTFLVDPLLVDTLSVDNSPLSLDKENIIIEPGSEPSNFNGTLHYNNGKTYTLTAPEGHTLLINATPSNSGITIFVTGEDGINLGWVPAGSQFSAVLPTSQNYHIDLTLPEDTNELDYGLTVAVQ